MSVLSHAGQNCPKASFRTEGTDVAETVVSSILSIHEDFSIFDLTHSTQSSPLSLSHFLAVRKLNLKQQHHN